MRWLTVFLILFVVCMLMPAISTAEEMSTTESTMADSSHDQMHKGHGLLARLFGVHRRENRRTRRSSRRSHRGSGMHRSSSGCANCARVSAVEQAPALE